MNGNWTIPVLVSILILGSLGLSQQVFALPISVTHSNVAGSCDDLVVPPNVTLN